MRKLIGVLLLFLGIAIVIYPSYRRQSEIEQQKELLKVFDETMQTLSEKNDVRIIADEKIRSDIALDTLDEIPDFEPEVNINDEVTESPTIEDSPPPTREERNQYIQSQWPVEAKLVIDKIDMIVPVISEVRSDYLDVTVCAIEETSKPWEKGNYAIAGHRSLTYGRHFNRLNELELGDSIIVEDLNSISYTYEVFYITIVHESDVSVLEDNGFNEITLITCDPIGEKNPDKRLVVKGKMK